MLKLLTVFSRQDIFMKKIHEEGTKVDDMIQRLDMIFQFSVLWSLGAIVQKKNQNDFNYTMRGICSQITKLEGKGKKQFRIERTSQFPD